MPGPRTLLASEGLDITIDDTFYTVDHAYDYVTDGDTRSISSDDDGNGVRLGHDESNEYNKREDKKNTVS